MPYLEDGETWTAATDVYEHGMAENKPGHKKFATYQLPKWAKHPLSHPMNGIMVGPKEYMHAAGDGFTNPMDWSIAHIGAIWGDMEIIRLCTDEELHWRCVGGQTPAHYCVMHGTPWVLQAMVEKGVDVTVPDNAGTTPEEQVWRSDHLHSVEMEWVFQACKGELTEKNSQKAQEYRLVKNRLPGNESVITEKLDKDMLKMRKFWYNMGDYELPYKVPTPEELAEMPLDLPKSRVTVEKKKLPSIPVALLFPGQGSQYVGMMKEVVDRPVVAEMLEKATSILGWDPKDLALNGPEAKIAETEFCQPIMFIAGLAALDVLKMGRPECAERPQAVAGLSSGEYTALVAAGVLEFEDGLELVRLRAKAMQKAVAIGEHAMCSVAGLDRGKLDKLCEEALKSDTSERPVCKVATFLFPSGFTVSGTKQSIDKLCKLATAAKALQARAIKSGGAFHSAMMVPAVGEVERAIDSMVPRMRPPRCAIYFNVLGKKVAAGADPASFVDYLKQQLVTEVLWEPTVKAMIMDGVKDFFEVGPLKQLKAMIKRIDAEAFKRTENVAV